MPNKIIIPVFILSLIFVTGCATSRPALVHFPVYFESLETNTIRTEVSSTKYAFSPWAELNSREDVYAEDIKVWALKTLDKFVLHVAQPTALDDFNDSRAEIDPRLIHVSINGQRRTDATINNGQFDFLFSIPKNNRINNRYVLDLDYNNLFRTRENISIFWVDKLE